MAVDAVVAGIELALYEPGIVAVLKAAGVDRLKVALPREQLARQAAPELLGLGNGLLVELLVLVEIGNVRFPGRVLAGGWLAGGAVN
jgi:hypothetical protein